MGWSYVHTYIAKMCSTVHVLYCTYFSVRDISIKMVIKGVFYSYEQGKNKINLKIVGGK